MSGVIETGKKKLEKANEEYNSTKEDGCTFNITCCGEISVDESSMDSQHTFILKCQGCGSSFLVERPD